MKKIFAFFIILMSVQVCFADVLEEKNMEIVKKMFTDFAEKRDINQLDHFYSKDFILVSNNKSYDYDTYKKQHEVIYKELKSLKVLRYDDLFAEKNKVVARMAIKLTKKSGQTHTFYVIAIIRIQNDKIDRIWEITYPTWSDKLPRVKK